MIRPILLSALSLVTTFGIGSFDRSATWAESPKIGASVNGFTLPVVGDDGEVSLTQELTEGPVVVVVLRGYPGYQCPACQRQVASFANRAKTLGQLTHRVILVYPGPADTLSAHAEEFMGQRSLPEPLKIVRDADMKMVDDWGLRWNAPRETAYPSTFIIKQDGTVAWKKVSDNHAGRAEAEEVVNELRKLAKAQ
ncbi:Redoxin [Rubripirellula amarantea]|uniref:Redoxin n=1 Tax=Rubripirellula amarantea TaxID=2527999 RepID=A0A5C5WTS6_9BACT|nr:redoxin domain-containing protein [Rubripirellula amarantea]TWT53511.1 Redoxin [Rubripirellula amarantea]